MTLKDRILDAVLVSTPLATFGAMAIFLHLVGVDQPINLILLGIGTAATMWMLWEWKRWALKQARWRRELAERGQLDDPTPIVTPPKFDEMLLARSEDRTERKRSM